MRPARVAAGAAAGLVNAGLAGRVAMLALAPVVVLLPIAPAERAARTAEVSRRMASEAPVQARNG